MVLSEIFIIFMVTVLKANSNTELLESNANIKANVSTWRIKAELLRELLRAGVLCDVCSSC